MEQDYIIDEKEIMQMMMENWKRLHTPAKRAYRKVGRIVICPFCDSGLKFKYCECSIKEEYQEYVQ